MANAFWMLALVVALVLLNAFFVAAEFAIVKVRATQIAGRAAMGDRRAKLATKVTRDLNAYLNACQLGITLASLGLGWVGEPAVARLIEPMFLALGWGSEAALHTAAFVTAFIIITVLHIVLGEVVPKAYSIQAAEKATLWLAPPLHAFYVLFKPAIFLLNAASNAVLRLLGVKPGSAESAHTADEIRLLLTEAGEKNIIEAQPAQLMLRAFHLPELSAREVMTPRTRLVWLDVLRPFEESVARAKEAGYSRYPVGEAGVDNVIGFVHYRDLMELATSGAQSKDLRGILRPIVFVPDTAPLETVLNTLLRRGTHMACVQEESSGTAGILSLEDIFEELFGEIRDEFDVGEPESIRRFDDGRIVVSGAMPIHEASHALAIEVAQTEATTVSGYLTEIIGRVPLRGERFTLGPFDGVVREADKKRVLAVELVRRPAEDEEYE